MTLCSVFNCNERSEKQSSSGVHFHVFPCRSKSPTRFRSWVNYCKRKNFNPGNGARICSMHFKSEDYNQSDLLRQQLMPNIKVKVKLNANAVPTVPQNIPFTSNLSEREKRKRSKEKKQIISSIMTSTPKKLKPSFGSFENSECESSDVDEVEGGNLVAITNESFVAGKQNEIGIQCELGSEVLKSHHNLSLNLSLDEFSSSEDESFEVYDEDIEVIQTGKNVIKKSKEIENDSCYIVFWESLSILFTRCHYCNAKVENIHNYTKGAMLAVQTICENKHIFKWTTQPLSDKRLVGNILMGAALTLSGVLFNQMKTFCSSLKLAFFSRTVYDKFINNYTAPVVKLIWDQHRQNNINELKMGTSIWLAGDGQFDSPGFCAKYCTYSVMDVRSSKIIDFKITQKGMVQGDLEKKACESLLQELEKNDECNINVFLTDRHKGIRCYIRTHHPNIEHEFDVWHLSKSLTKRLKTLEKNHHSSFMWKTSIINHLWWSAQTCNGNGTVLVEKFTSVLYHISNIHQWNDDNGQIKKCEHDPLTDEEIKNKLWIHKNSDSYFALKKIITAKDLLKDLLHAKHFIHTGRLESYHNTRLKYMPKRIHLKYEGMYIRSIIAILDHNSNTDKKIVGDKMVYSKPLGRYTIKNTYENTEGNWRIDIMNKVHLMAIEGSSGPLRLPEKNLIPKNIVQTPKPDIEELKSKKYSRFK